MIPTYTIGRLSWQKIGPLKKVQISFKFGFWCLLCQSKELFTMKLKEAVYSAMSSQENGGYLRSYSTHSATMQKSVAMGTTISRTEMNI